MTTDIVISFDTTGSMYSCIIEVRRRVKSIIERLFSTIPDLRVGLVMHGDYCDNRLCFTGVDLTTDRELLLQVLQETPNTHGGDFDECYELVLNRVARFSWKADNKAVIMIGDATPHAVGYRYGGTVNNLNWRDEAQVLSDIGVSIYAVQALGRGGSTSFYESLSRITNGQKLELNQLTDIVETLIAIFYHGSGQKDKLVNYKNELVSSLRFNRNLAHVFEKLTGESVAVESDHSGLVPVPPYRFQILNVPSIIDIKSFVQGNGVTFKKGRGFYQFTKSEMIQEHKEVILRNKRNGDMFSGAEARNFIGLPFGERGTIRPKLFDEYEVFIQSTSSNRKLMPNTKFLYENET